MLKPQKPCTLCEKSHATHTAIIVRMRRFIRILSAPALLCGNQSSFRRPAEVQRRCRGLARGFCDLNWILSGGRIHERPHPFGPGLARPRSQRPLSVQKPTPHTREKPTWVAIWRPIEKIAICLAVMDGHVPHLSNVDICTRAAGG